MGIPESIRKRYSLFNGEYRRENVDRAISDLLDMSRRLVSENDKIKTELSGSTDRLAATEKKLSDLEGEISEKDEKLREAGDGLRESRTVEQYLRDELRLAREKLAAAAEKASAAEAALADAGKKLSETEEKLAQTEEKLAASGEKLSETEERLAGTEEALAEAEKRLAQAAQEAPDGEKSAERDQADVLLSIESALAALKLTVDRMNEKLDAKDATDKDRDADEGPGIVLVSAETVTPDRAGEQPAQAAVPAVKETGSDGADAREAFPAKDAEMQTENAGPSAAAEETPEDIDPEPDETASDAADAADEAESVGELPDSLPEDAEDQSGDAQEALPEENEAPELLPEEAESENIPAEDAGPDASTDAADAAEEETEPVEDGSEDELLTSLEAVFGKRPEERDDSSAPDSDIPDVAADDIAADAETMTEAGSGDSAEDGKVEAADEVDELNAKLRTLLGFLSTEHASPEADEAPEAAAEEDAGIQKDAAEEDLDISEAAAGEAAPTAKEPEVGDTAPEALSIVFPDEGEAVKDLPEEKPALREETGAPEKEKEIPGAPSGTAEDRRSFSDMRSSLEAIRRKLKR